MQIISPTIIWAIVGLGLIVLEIFTTSFFILFFGLGALIVAGIKLFGLSNLPIELVIFALIGVSGIIFFRKKVSDSFKNTKGIQIDKEKIITLSEDIAAGKTGSVTYLGSPWRATNKSADDMKKGEDVRIENIDGVTLMLNKKI